MVARELAYLSVAVEIVHSEVSFHIQRRSDAIVAAHHFSNRNVLVHDILTTEHEASHVVLILLQFMDVH